MYGVFSCVLKLFWGSTSLEKSELLRIGDRRDEAQLARVLGCKVVSLLINYLGVPLGVKYKNTRMWELVVEMLKKTLAGWKRNFLSKGGRLTLTKSTLNNLPIYYSSTLTIPVKVTRRLEVIQYRFLWGDEEGMMRYHLVKWEDVKLPINQGGLGIRSLAGMNVTLRRKWIWRFMNEEDGI